MDEYGLPAYDAGVLTSHIRTADYFEGAVKAHNNPKGISNWIMSEGYSWLNKQDVDTTLGDIPIKPESLAELVRLIDDGTITGKIGKQVFPLMIETGKTPAVIVEEEGLKPMEDSSIEPIVDAVLAANPRAVEELRGGKDKAIGALIGQVMRQTGGKANPATLTPMIRKKVGLE
jgi:aspartyl-tRNA(Asn)/glutamyl-tRNA(Gln) amidotransferase subunit B